MPKLKTKSGAKKRFKISGTGKVIAAQAGKRHGMIKRTNKQIRNLRGTHALFKSDGDNIKKYWMPRLIPRDPPQSAICFTLKGDQSWPASNVASPPTPSTRKF
jgi:large subunit ribosomal protein L35